MYRKFKATNIFNGYAMLPAEMVLVTDADGRIMDTVHENEAGDDVLNLEGILCPGFINAHCHIELSHMKGLIPQHTGLVKFIEQVMVKRHAGPEEKMEAMLQAEKEMYENGIVATGDICNTTDSIELKKQSKICWRNFIEITGFVEENAAKRLNEMEQVEREFSKTFRGSPRNAQPLAGLTPHAPYSVSKKLFQLINERTAGNIISVHNQETADENEIFRTKSGGFLPFYRQLGIDISSFAATGASSFQSWLPYFTNQQQIIAVHNSFINADDIQSAVKAGQQVTFCLCPNANLYIENRLPPVDLLISNNCNIVLGTDSLASNHSLSIPDEINTLLRHFPQLGLEEVLPWATINGARALGFAQQLGSFENGKTPGLLLIKKTPPEQLPGIYGIEIML